MNKITSTQVLLEIQYLPPIQYFSKFISAEKVLLEQHENYQKGSYRNRCHIAGANGLLRLSIPLQSGKNRRTNIKDVKIAYAEDWQALHWQSIRSAYGKAPFFEFYADELAQQFQQKPTFLFDWNYNLLVLLVELLGLDCTLALTETYQKASNTNLKDWRNVIFPKKQRQKTDNTFEAVSYPQVFEERHGFIPNLSILDLIFCTGPQSILILEQTVLSFEG